MRSKTTRQRDETKNDNDNGLITIERFLYDLLINPNRCSAMFPFSLSSASSSSLCLVADSLEKWTAHTHAHEHASFLFLLYLCVWNTKCSPGFSFRFVSFFYIFFNLLSHFIVLSKWWIFFVYLGKSNVFFVIHLFSSFSLVSFI